MTIYIFDTKPNISLKNESVKSLLKKLTIRYRVWFEFIYQARRVDVQSL